jgi:predicted phage gp36 major capsid-like protein
LKAKSDLSSFHEPQSVEHDQQLHRADENQEFLEQGQQDNSQQGHVRKKAGHGQQDQDNEQGQGDNQLLRDRTESRRNGKSSRSSRRYKKDRISERLNRTSYVRTQEESNGDELGFEAFKYGLGLLARNHPKSEDLHG